MFHLHAFRLAVKTTLRHVWTDVEKGFFLTAIPLKDRKPASLPAPSSHVYGFIETLPAEELAVVEI
jgi:hypothetical protein